MDTQWSKIPDLIKERFEAAKQLFASCVVPELDRLIKTTGDIKIPEYQRLLAMANIYNLTCAKGTLGEEEVIQYIQAITDLYEQLFQYEEVELADKVAQQLYSIGIKDTDTNKEVKEAL